MEIDLADQTKRASQSDDHVDVVGVKNINLKSWQALHRLRLECMQLGSTIIHAPTCQLYRLICINSVAIVAGLKGF